VSEVNSLLEKVKHIHFIGIGGSGMFPLAEILHAQGYIISGSDINEGETLGRARALGINVILGQKPENIIGAEMIVFTAALLSDNVELKAALESGIPTLERAKLFGAITQRYSNCIGVSGTHGKTTVTAMLTQIMLEADFSPTAVIGGKLPLTGTNGLVGNSEHMICEACEFADTFLELSPDTAIILNIDADHLDYFKTVENLIASFTKFAQKATRLVIYNGDDEKTLKAISPLKNKNLITFGTKDGNNYIAKEITLKNSYASFDIIRHGNFLGRLQLAVPGRHNVLNALAAVAAAMESGVNFESCKSAIENFRGAGRRFEFLGTYNGITIADDYAHHPEEIKVTLEAAKEMGYKKVWAVFQPFTFSRTSMLLKEFADSLSIADRVVMTEVMGAREVNTYHIYTYHLAEKIPGSVWFKTFEEVASYVVENAISGDLVITLGCGDIYKAAKIMVNLLKDRQEK
jgi:UDP-N-acetylmuramate--alanine ligase